MNKLVLLGRLTKAPDIRYSQANNMKVANFNLAVNRKYVKPGEERQADFFNIIAYSKLADFVEKYLKQGIQICISGRLQNRSWKDKNGTMHYVTEVIAEEIDFAESQKKLDDSILYAKTAVNTSTSNNANESVITGDGDDLPF